MQTPGRLNAAGCWLVQAHPTMAYVLPDNLEELEAQPPSPFDGRRKSGRKRQARLTAWRRAQGLCASCGENSAEPGTRCEECRRIARLKFHTRKERQGNIERSRSFAYHIAHGKSVSEAWALSGLAFDSPKVKGQ